MITTGLTMAVAGSLLAFWPTLAEPFMLPKLLLVFLGAALVHAGVAWRERRGAAGDYGLALLPAAVWAFALFDALLFSADRPLSLYGARGSYSGSLVPAAAIILTVLAAARAKPSRGQAHAIVAWSGFSLAAVTVLWHASILYPFSQTQLEQFGGRAFGPMGGPVFLGPALAVCLPSALQYALGRSPAAALVPSLVLAALILSGTRAAMAAAVLASLYMAVQMGQLRLRICLAAAGPAVLAVVVSRPGFLASDLGRLEVWKVALQAFLERPLLGWGPDTFGVISRRFLDNDFTAAVNSDLIVPMHAHNLLLQGLASCGLLVLLPFAVTAAVLGVLHARRSSSEDFPAWAAFLVALLCSMTNPMPTAAWLIPLVLLCTIAPGYPASSSAAPKLSLALGLACLLPALVVSRHARAEWHTRAGVEYWGQNHGLKAAEEFNKAARLNPYNAEHVARQLDGSRNLIVFLELEHQARVINDGLRIAQKNAKRHPEDPLALQTLSAQYTLAALATTGPLHDTYLDQAEYRMSDAKERAPTYSPNLYRLSALQRAKGGN